MITYQRSQLKQLANKRHEEEKNYMATLEAVELPIATYTGDTAVEADGDGMDGNEETEFDTGGNETIGYGNEDFDGVDVNDSNEGNNSDNDVSLVLSQHMVND